MISNRNKLQISLVQIFLIVIVVMLTLVFPAQYIEYNRQLAAENDKPYTTTALRERDARVIGSNDAGRVAGATTETATELIRVPLTTIYIDPYSESGFLTLTGAGLASVSGVIITYLLLTGKRS